MKGIIIMREIVIGFSDFWDGFDPKDNIFYRLLSRKYKVIVKDSSSDDIQYLFYSVFGDEYLSHKCVRIFASAENICPNFNLCDYAIGFEYMDFEDRFYRFPNYFYDHYKYDFDLINNNTKLYGDFPENRKFCGMVVSNNLFADPFRENFFYELSKYKRVDSGGRALNNIGMPTGVEDKREFLRGYKFSIAFENSSYSGYCTEKLLQAFSSGTVPIYWGDPTVSKIFNKASFIDCTGLSLSEAVDKVKQVDQDDNLYLQMLNANPLIDSTISDRTEEGLMDWLSNIVEQDYKKAKRVPQYGKMAVYEENYRKKAKLEHIIKKHGKIYGLAKKIIGSKI